jgi:hypothetical protein
MEHETPKGADLPYHVPDKDKDAKAEGGEPGAPAADNPYVLRPGVPVFDEHDDLDEHGQVLRRFDRPALEEIALRCNARERATGDLCPITLGHTIDGAPEHQQPPIVGFARNFRVGAFGPAQRNGILADFYLRRDRYSQAMDFPRRSVELWVKERFIDPIALLRRTPQRDLGLLTHGRNGRLILRYAMDDFPPADGGEFRPPALQTPPLSPGPADVPPVPPTGQQPPPPLFMPDPTLPPDAQDPDPADMEKFMRCMRRFMMQGGPPAMPSTPPPLPPPAAPTGTPTPLRTEMGGAAGPGFPSATNVSVPRLPEPEPERLSMYGKNDVQADSDAIRFVRMETELLRMQKEREGDRLRWEQERQQLLQRFEAQLADYRKEREGERLDYSREKSKRIVAQLEYEGFVIQRPHELVETMARMDEAGRIGKEKEVRENYAKAPVGGSPVPVAQGGLDSYYGPPQTTPAQQQAAIKLATEKRIGFDEALGEVKKR